MHTKNVMLVICCSLIGTTSVEAKKKRSPESVCAFPKDAGIVLRPRRFICSNPTAESCVETKDFYVGPADGYIAIEGEWNKLEMSAQIPNSQILFFFNTTGIVQKMQSDLTATFFRINLSEFWLQRRPLLVPAVVKRIITDFTFLDEYPEITGCASIKIIPSLLPRPISPPVHIPLSLFGRTG